MIYQISLTAAISQMLFFVGYLFFARIPAKPLYDRYKKSCRIMGCAILLLALNYMVHDVINPRFHGEQDWAIWMNLCTYFGEIWLFYSALVMLLDVSFERKFWQQTAVFVALWAVYIGVSGAALWLVPEAWHIWVLVLQGLVFLPVILWHGVRLSRAYKQAVRLFDATHSDDISAYIHWMSVIVYWAIIYGTLCGLFTFLPDGLHFLTIGGERDGETLTIVVTTDDDEWVVRQPITFIENDMKGSMETPFRISIDDATRISDIRGDGEDSIYDLAGRKRTKNDINRGVYIVNGNKAVKK